MVKTNKEIVAYVCFDDAIQSFLNIVNCRTPLADMDTDEIKKLLLKAGKNKIIADRASKVVSHFVP